MTTHRAVAVVTGGSSGIGAATARLFASRGYAVAILDINQERGEKMAEAISSDVGNASYYACDTADAKSVDAAAARVEKDLCRRRALDGMTLVRFALIRLQSSHHRPSRRTR